MEGGRGKGYRREGKEKEKRGRREGRGNRPAPVGAASRRDPAERARKVQTKRPAKRLGAWFALRELGAAGKKARQKIKIVFFELALRDPWGCVILHKNIAQCQ